MTEYQQMLKAKLLRRRSARRDTEVYPRRCRMIKAGDKVDYHAIIGGPATSRCETVEYVTKISGEGVAWLHGRAGLVSLDALTPSIEDESIQSLREQCDKYREALEFIARQKDLEGNWAVLVAKHAIQEGGR